jgi:hypothetical protein
MLGSGVAQSVEHMRRRAALNTMWRHFHCVAGAGVVCVWQVSFRARSCGCVSLAAILGIAPHTGKHPAGGWVPPKPVCVLHCARAVLGWCKPGVARLAGQPAAGGLCLCLSVGLGVQQGAHLSQSISAAMHCVCCVLSSAAAWVAVSVCRSVVTAQRRAAASQ